MGILERIASIEQEVNRTQKNKATEYHLGTLKAKLAKLRQELIDSVSTSKQSGEGFDVMKSGDARVALVGFPSVGKSTLLCRVTETTSATASYEFTTLACIPGNIYYNGARIQLLDLPGIIEGASQGKGRGKQVISIARTSDMILMLLDAIHGARQRCFFRLFSRELLVEELESVGIRLNIRPPNVYFRRRTTGGIAYTATVPLVHINEKMVQSILHEYKIYHCELIIREDITVDTLIDVIVGNRRYIKCIFVYNKIDQLTLEEVEHLALQPNSVVISGGQEWNLDVLIETIWNRLELLRIYTKKPGNFPDFSKALIIRRGSTIEHVCHAIHRTLPSQFRYALVWGSSAKHQPQRVGLSHKVEDEDVIQIVKKVS